MTILELKYYNTMMDTQKSIAKSLKIIAEHLQKLEDGEQN